jgi:monoamine oxidase
VPEITRRRLIGAAAVGAAGTAAAAAPGAQAKRRRTRSVDVAVIGAGLAGLTAARALRKAGRSVVVLEARDRVGGRCFSRPLGGGASDVANMGATFVGPTHTAVLALMKELGISTFPTYSEGKLVWYEDGERKTYTGLVPPTEPEAVVELATSVPVIESMAKTVPLDAPYNAPRALEWDSKTVDTWMNENLPNPKARAVVSLLVEAVLSVEPRDISLLYFLFYVHSAGSINALVANAGDGGAQDFRVSGGTQRIAIAMARQLGKRVVLGAPVRSITQANQRVEVHADGLRVLCGRVIVAIPPHLAGRIVYSPALPPLRDQLTQRYPIGSLIKTIAVYDRPFWRDEGLNGQVTSDQGPVKAMFDASPKSGSPGVLLGFIDGDDARILAGASAAKRRAKALESHVRYFGAAAGNPRRYLDQPWEREVYTRGCPVGVAPPGVTTSFGRALRAPVGRIHWAGTETATVWNGYMDGAIRSGERAAKEVLTA